MPPWCRRYCSGHVGAALWRRGREPSRQTGRPAGRWKSGAGAASIARGWRRPGAEAQLRDTRVWRSCGGRCTRVGTDAPCRSIDGRRGRIDRMRQAPDRGRTWTSAPGRRRPRETSGMFAGRDGTRQMSLHRSRDCRGDRGSGGGLGGIPGRTVNRHRDRDAIGAEQEAGGPCRLRHAAVAASDGKGNCIEGLYAAMRVRIVFVERRRIAQQN